MIKVFSWVTGQVLHQFVIHQAPVRMIKKIDEDLFMSCSDDRTMKIWRVQLEKEKPTEFSLVF